MLAVAALAIGGIVTFLVTRFSDRAKTRDSNASRASDAEITVRAKFVTDLAQRVGDLEQRLDRANQRERELVERYRADTEAIERRYRHLTSSLVFHAAILRRHLVRCGEQVPLFTGWDKFIEEGGQVREEWIEAISDVIAEHPRRRKPDDEGDG